MEEKILKIIYDCSKKGKLLDYSALDKILTVVIKEKALNQMIQKYVVYSSISDARLTSDECQDLKATICYRPNKNQICVIGDNYDEYIAQLKSMPLGKDYFETIFYQNIILTEKLLHLIGHVLQRRLLNNSLTTGHQLTAKLATLTQVSNPDKIIESNQYNPTEREADLFALATARRLVGFIKNELPQTNEIVNQELRDRTKKDYEKINGHVISPIDKYCEINNSRELYNKFFNMYRMQFLSFDLNDKLRWGLPINEQEYGCLDDHVYRIKL